ncbi:hypothetical protein SAMN00017405_2225 [Desulfonispora thiosulfatigenes DSM 11270]|uniref:Uncharacterized protein n=1 Tax=Desulfonispora thiosulfatigenes DSM 11270 TaxID=656914 RepID=A0A1W1VE44_DESTI|nr:hypothetical protein [Desulfonispora thiosulfatigenes]SMB91669.1 hypothetical protein SAMN00017405_2225 [Desulfonispora thiosulfatigenes DSM 11270]
MKRIFCILLWFITLVVIAFSLFNTLSFQYFWAVIIFLSIYFGLNTSQEIKISDEMSHQIITWVNKYKQYSYCERQWFLEKVVNRSVASNKSQEAIKFLNYILKAEPDNDLAKNLMVSIWGMEVLNTYTQNKR